VSRTIIEDIILPPLRGRASPTTIPSQSLGARILFMAHPIKAYLDLGERGFFTERIFDHGIISGTPASLCESEI
jgi:hypothetical protein